MLDAPSRIQREGASQYFGEEMREYHTAYPLSWRMFDAAEALVKRTWPARLAPGLPYLLLFPALLVTGLLVIGLIDIADSSLHVLDRATFRPSPSYSLDNFDKALSLPLFRNIGLRSFAGAVLVTVFTLALAFPYAYVLVRTESAVLRKLLLIVLFMPFFIGQVVRAYGWLIILGNEGILNASLAIFGIGPFRLLFNYWAVLFGLVQTMIPFAVLMLAPALTAIPKETERAAESLGANWIRTFRYVVIPLARPGMIGAAIVVFTLTLTDFAIPAVLGGGSNDFIANAIYDQFFRTSDAGLGSALTVLLIVVGSATVGLTLLLAGMGTLGLAGRDDD
jgi:putative spermidine/putrescine transport system permease protein